MASPIKTVVVVGGGAAGWITAGLLAAKHFPQGNDGLKIKVVESPDIPIIGVGEGTWPSMRVTLQKMGINEFDFLRECHASFKQGSKFCRWYTDDQSDFYYHPFDPPEGLHDVNVAEYWLSRTDEKSFSSSVCAQESICEEHLAPKAATSPEYAGFSNYGYHLDAGAFSVFLREHCTKRLGVELIADTMIGIKSRECGSISAVETQRSGDIQGDLFVDCTGFRSLLLGQHYGVKLKSKSDILFQDKALAVQVPYENGAPVQSPTVSTAQAAGWIWDVSLSTRRGIGHVYSSAHMDEEQAIECVRRYLGLEEKVFAKHSIRSLSIGSGYRETFWKKNCVAIGLSAGFLEPLEASALMLIETSANLIADHMPTTHNAMEIISARFNNKMHHLWDRIIHFLKLHYCLSARDEPFWRDNRSPDSMPAELIDDLALWTEQVPWQDGLGAGSELFPAASYQYVLYGMGFSTRPNPRGVSESVSHFSRSQFDGVERNVQRLKALLLSNRDLLDQINIGAQGNA